MTLDGPWPRLAPFLHLVLMVAVISLNWLVFRDLVHQNYFLWYLKNGALISLATGFLALTWKDMKARIGLISSHPSAYFAACFQILGVFVYSLSTSNTERVQPKEIGFDIGLNLKIARLIDDVLYFLLSIVMMVLGLAWLVIVAPLAYFVTLIAGVPARQELRGKIAPTYVHEETRDRFRGDKGNVTILEPAETETETVPSPAYLSFARDPFAVTQAMTALVLWSASIIYDRVS